MAGKTEGLTIKTDITESNNAGYGGGGEMAPWLRANLLDALSKDKSSGPGTHVR